MDDIKAVINETCDIDQQGFVPISQILSVLHELKGLKLKLEDFLEMIQYLGIEMKGDKILLKSFLKNSFIPQLFGNDDENEVENRMNDDVSSNIRKILENLENNSGKIKKNQLKYVLESLETGHEITDDYVDLLMNKLDVDMKGYITVDDLIGAFKNMSEINLNHHEKDDIFSDDHQSESLEDIFVTKNHHKQDDEDFEIVPDDEYNSLVKNSGEDKNVKVLKNENNYLKNRLSTLESEVTKLHESSEGQYKKDTRTTAINKSPQSIIKKT